jgi:hypothetical protein
MLRRILILTLAMGLSGTAASADASIASDGAVTIHPGETISVAFAGDDDLSQPKLASDTNAPSTMTFTLKAEAGLGLMLDIQSHLGVTVKYDAVMTVGRHAVHTSSCPVLAGKASFENWSDPITELKLSGFRKLDGARMVCD